MRAVVTGGATGIGLAISRRLLADGAAVLVAARSDAELATGLAALRLDYPDDPEPAPAGGLVLTRICGFAGDLAAPRVADDMVAAAVAQLYGVDVLVNNAGGGVIRPTLEHTEETLRATIDNNLWTTLRSCLAVLPHMIEKGGGRIINIGAESVRNGLTDHAVYNAAKGGVHALATGLAREFAGAGITVNTVAPSYTLTPELAAAVDAGTIPSRLRTVLDDAVSLIPMGRGAYPEEVASVVAFLARGDSSFVTGQTISVNGGSSMG